jgi:hypothetical protein
MVWERKKTEITAESLEWCRLHQGTKAIPRHKAGARVPEKVSFAWAADSIPRHLLSSPA